MIKPNLTHEPPLLNSGIRVSLVGWTAYLTRDWTSGGICKTCLSLAMDFPRRSQGASGIRRAPSWLGMEHLTDEQRRVLNMTAMWAAQVGISPSDAIEVDLLTFMTTKCTVFPQQRCFDCQEIYADQGAIGLERLWEAPFGPLSAYQVDKVKATPVATFWFEPQVAHVAESYGANQDAEHALRLGAWEGLERLATVARIPGSEVTLSTPRELREPSVDPVRLGLPESLCDGFIPYSPELELSWVQAQSMDGQDVLVPEQMVYYQHPDRGRFVDLCSSGCAVGPDLDGAMSAALFELIERDAFMLVWHRASKASQLDIPTLPEQLGERITQIRDHLGFEVRLADITTEFEVPCVLGVGVNLESKEDPNEPAQYCSSAAHLSFEQAAAHALDELSMLIEGQGQYYRTHRARAAELAREPSRVSSMEDHALLGAHPVMRKAMMSMLGDESKTRWSPPTRRPWQDEEPLAQLREQFARVGASACFVDQTGPWHRAAGVKAVRALAPGLVPMTFGFGHERIRGLPRLPRRGTGWPHPFA